MSIVLFAIIGAVLDMNGWYWFALGLYGAAKIAIWMSRLGSLMDGLEENQEE